MRAVRKGDIVPRTKQRDGIYQRADRPGEFWGSWQDASGRRRRRKLNAATLKQAQVLLNAEWMRADEIKTKGYTAPSKDSCGAVFDRYLNYQKPRLSHGSYERTKGIIEGYLRPAFGSLCVGEIRRTDIQDYVTRRAAVVSPGTTIKEANVLTGSLSWPRRTAHVDRCLPGLAAPDCGARRLYGNAPGRGSGASLAAR